MRFFPKYISALTLGMTACLALSACGGSETPVTDDPTKPFGQSPSSEEPQSPTPPESSEEPPSELNPVPPEPKDSGAPTSPTPKTKFTEHCHPGPKGDYAEALNGTHQHLPAYEWARGGACIHRPLREAWAASRNQVLMYWANDDGVQYSFEVLPPPAKVDFHYLVHATAKWFFKWHVEWFHTVAKGTLKDPQEVVVNWQRTSGTNHFSFFRGSIVLKAMTPTVTAIEMDNRIKADQTNDSDAFDSLAELVEKLSNGAPNQDAAYP